MTILAEGLIHIAVQDYLRTKGWQLLGGEHPGGSADRLRRIYIKDPTVARDQSPDPRRHSKGAVKVDLVAYKNQHLLLVEMKPAYSLSDENKLVNIITNRREHLHSALFDRCGLTPQDVVDITLALGFSLGSLYRARPDFAYFLVSADRSVEAVTGSLLPRLDV